MAVLLVQEVVVEVQLRRRYLQAALSAIWLIGFVPSLRETTSRMIEVHFESDLTGLSPSYSKYPILL